MNRIWTELFGAVEVLNSKNPASEDKSYKIYAFTNYLEILGFSKWRKTTKKMRKKGWNFSANFVESKKPFLDLISNPL